ncbi:MAG: hypothetical protein FWG09_08175, partial [Synergistaceae bacterium]|nr:hypothetical protein [Synergistaceae bacterium]
MKKIYIFALILAFLPVTFASAEAAGSEGIEYSNGPLGFSLTLPLSWDGLYSVHESASSLGGGVWVEFRNIRSDAAGYGGHIFSIFISESEPGDIPGMREISGEGGKKHITQSRRTFNLTTTTALLRMS